MTTTARTRADIRADIRAAEKAEVLVETNEGTYSAAEAHAAIGTGDPRHANYRVYESAAGARRTEGCDPVRAPGYARRYGAASLAELRRRLAALKAELRTAK